MAWTDHTPSTAPGSVVVTRPEPQCQHWVSRLNHAGIDAVGLPMLHIGPAPNPERVATDMEQWLGTVKPGYRAIMLVSSAAIHGLWQVLGPQGVERLFASTALGLRWWVTGPGSAATLVSLGVDPQAIDQPSAVGPQVQFDSQALWGKVGHQVTADAKVMLVRGVGGAGNGVGGGNAWLEAQLNQRACAVSVIAAYQRLAPDWDEPQRQLLQRLMAEPSVWLLTSVEAMGHLPRHDWSDHTALVTHPRQRDAALKLGFGRVLLSDPRLEQVIASLKSLQ